MEFKEGDKVVYIPDGKVYDFGYIGQTGKAILYEEGEMNAQDGFAVALNDIKHLKVKEKRMNNVIQKPFYRKEIFVNQSNKKELLIINEIKAETFDNILNYNFTLEHSPFIPGSLKISVVPLRGSIITAIDNGEGNIISSAGISGEIVFGNSIQLSLMSYPDHRAQILASYRVAAFYVNKNERRLLNHVFSDVKSLDRFSLNWDHLKKNKKGDYLLYSDVEKIFLELLRGDCD